MLRQFTSLNLLANWQTRLVSFGLLPLINLLLLLLIDGQYHHQFNWAVAVMTAPLAGGNLTMNSLSQLLVTDHNLGIDRIMVVKHPLSITYWWDKIAAAGSVGGLLTLTNLILLAIFGAPHGLLERAFLLAPVLLISGIALGWVSFIAAWTYVNTYFYVNLVSTFLTVTAGVLIPLPQYPDWLRVISSIFPFAHTLETIRSGQGHWWLDLFCTAGWLLLGCLLYSYRSHQLLHGNRKSW